MGDKVELIFENAKLMDLEGIPVPYKKFAVSFVIEVTAEDSKSDDLTWLVNRYRRRPKNKKAGSAPNGDIHSFDGAVEEFPRLFSGWFSRSQLQNPGERI